MSTVNHHLGLYVLRYLDADAGRAELFTIEEERALAESLAAVAEAIRLRAEAREIRQVTDRSDDTAT